ncbi:MAG: pyridoxamine 5'-phosphate oxidase family protein [Pseudomonadota bacterium]
MPTIDTLDKLEALYDAPVTRSLTKVTPRITPLYREWIGACKFCVLSTVGAEGTDASPRGDDGPVIHIADDKTVWLPDWRGNNRIDSLRNIVRDPRVSLMFMIPGANNVIRLNGTAILTTDPQLTGTFEQAGKHPKLVIVITVGELYFQCAKALMRSRLWSDDPRTKVPTAGQFVKEQDAGFDAETYDTGYAEYAKPRMW